MEGRTHFAVGIVAGVGVASMSGQTDDLMGVTMTIVCGGLFSILPDIDEDGSMINNFIFPSLKRSLRSLALAVIGVIMITLYFLKGLSDWTLLTGIFATAVAYAPHRSVTHSLFALGYVSMTMYLANPSYTLVASLAYGSHLFTDALTRAGIPLFWPIKKRIGIKSLGIKMKSGGKLDDAVAMLSFVLAVIGFTYLFGQIIYNEALASGWLPDN
ncbi:metal-dependent hydrolase [Hazenella sp. IB182357]|uniref:Metal-dependent hydrolase n=1 Tax=Polycladospora coralii TaxID=2771432 RepID=A0A926NFV9_9BACL|nr:metal-dependent hydrolase [Polycladospora coralii]MBD1372804.1 metal-dependent hydrolase [Polycladospora coralii]MBS7529498.1 metal-dependent hydrolase [Polycladospora coralii]